MKKIITPFYFVCLSYAFCFISFAKDPLPTCFYLTGMNNQNIVFKVCGILNGLSEIDSFKNPEEESNEANCLQFLHKETLSILATGERTENFDTAVSRVIRSVFEKEGLEKFTDPIEKIDGVGGRKSTKEEYETAQKTIETIAQAGFVGNNFLEKIAVQDKDNESVKTNKNFVKKTFEDAINKKSKADITKQEESNKQTKLSEEEEYQNFLNNEEVKGLIYSAKSEKNEEKKNQNIEYLKNGCPKHSSAKFKQYLKDQGFEEEEDKSKKPKKSISPDNEVVDEVDEVDIDVVVTDSKFNRQEGISIEDHVNSKYGHLSEDVRNEIIAKAMSLQSE